MNATRLNELLASPGAISAEDLGALENLCRDFPAFGLPYFLLARAYHDRSDYRFKETLHAAALRCPDRLWLRDFMEGSQAKESESQDSVEMDSNLSVQAETIPQQVPAETAPLARPETPGEILVSGADAVLTEMPADANEPLELTPEPAISDQMQENEPAAEEQTIPSDSLQPLSAVINTKTGAETTEPAQPISEKPWRRKHVDPAAMTVYSIEDHFPPAEQPTEHEGVRDFFAWLRNPAKSDEKNAPEPEIKEDKDQIIQRFLETRPSVSRPKKEFFNPVNMAKKSEQEDPELVTETLANIYWKQGNTEKAIAMFEKLILKYPGKRPYFAALIQKIRQENES